jgi:hypothetical protein
LDKSAPDKSELDKLACDKSAPDKLAHDKSAPDKLAHDKSAPAEIQETFFLEKRYRFGLQIRVLATKNFKNFHRVGHPVASEFADSDR